MSDSTGARPHALNDDCWCEPQQVPAPREDGSIGWVVVHRFPTWFPDDQQGYSIAICACDGGPYLGARKAGAPCCCERCGFITPDQFEFLREEFTRPVAQTEVLGRTCTCLWLGLGPLTQEQRDPTCPTHGAPVLTAGPNGGCSSADNYAAACNTGFEAGVEQVLAELNEYAEEPYEDERNEDREAYLRDAARHLEEVFVDPISRPGERT